MQIIEQEDSRNDCPQGFATSGVYMVHKKNMVAQFSFGTQGSFDTINEAFVAMGLWLAERKDATTLTVRLMPRRRFEENNHG